MREKIIILIGNCHAEMGLILLDGASLSEEVGESILLGF